MDTQHGPVGLLDESASPAQEALSRIVEVFRDGYQAAADLRRSAASLSPIELQGELQEIEQSMLARISRICDQYQIRELGAARH